MSLPSPFGSGGFFRRPLRLSGGLGFRACVSSRPVFPPESLGKQAEKKGPGRETVRAFGGVVAGRPPRRAGFFYPRLSRAVRTDKRTRRQAGRLEMGLEPALEPAGAVRARLHRDARCVSVQKKRREPPQPKLNRRLRVGYDVQLGE